MNNLFMVIVAVVVVVVAIVIVDNDVDDVSYCITILLEYN